MKEATWVGGDNSGQFHVRAALYAQTSLTAVRALALVGSPSAKSLAVLEETGAQSTNEFLAGLSPEQRAIIGFPVCYCKVLLEIFRVAPY